MRPSRIRLSSRAEDDLDDAMEYIGEDDPERAEAWFADILECIALIAITPRGHPERTWAGVSRPLRTCPFRRYTIYYSVDSWGIRIERVLHCARNHGSALLQ